MKLNDLNLKIKKVISDLKQNKERMYIVSGITLTCLVTIWIFQKPTEINTESQTASELSFVIPKGFLVVPLELTNSNQLGNLVSKMGVLDIFIGNESRLLAKNLRVIKLNQDEHVSFGALVPENKASELQVIFSDKKLKGALKSVKSDATEFFSTRKKQVITETYQTQDAI